ncbi:MAG: very short patch repair endonuclease [Pyrinomonadaceae bacterium]
MAILVGKAPNFKNFKPSSEKASRALSKIKATDTKGEKLLRSVLWRMGFRFRKNVRDLPGKPDIVFPKHKVAIFCDGDFWHGRNWRKDKRRLQVGPNAPYWVAKIQANINRDKRYNKELRCLGWRVLRLWESDLRADVANTALSIAGILSTKTNQQH